jgi:dTMP kinase
VDGSGKSTQAQLLSQWVREAGFPVLVTREPGGTALAEKLRPLILDPTIPCSDRAELFLLLAARAQHVREVIAPALASGVIVISDRFSLSSLAYQGYGRGLPLADICSADAIARSGITPDHTFVLDVPLSLALSRIGARADRFEGEGQDFLQRVIDGYHALAKSATAITLIDGTATIDEIQHTLRQAVQPLLGMNGNMP